MLGALISALAQVAAAFGLAAIVYWVLRRPNRPFFTFVGLTRAPVRAMAAGAGVGIIFATTLLATPEVRALTGVQGTVASEVGQIDSTGELVFVLALSAVIKTAFTEEVIFRGLLGRNLIRWRGIQAGNLIQATCFGLVHLVLLALPGVSVGLVIVLVVLTGILGWVNGWINERLAGGSILPGWAAHATGNLITYSVGAGLI